MTPVMRGVPGTWLASWRRSRRHRSAARSFRHRIAREQLSLGARSSIRHRPPRSGVPNGTGAQVESKGGLPKFFRWSNDIPAPICRARAASVIELQYSAKSLSLDLTLFSAFSARAMVAWPPHRVRTARPRPGEGPPARQPARCGAGRGSPCPCPRPRRPAHRRPPVHWRPRRRRR